MSTEVRVEEHGDPGQDWDAFVEGHVGATFFHYRGWLEVVARAYGGRPHYLTAYRGTAVVGVLVSDDNGWGTTGSIGSVEVSGTASGSSSMPA